MGVKFNLKTPFKGVKNIRGKNIQKSYKHKGKTIKKWLIALLVFTDLVIALLDVDMRVGVTAIWFSVPGAMWNLQRGRNTEHSEQGGFDASKRSQW